MNIFNQIKKLNIKSLNMNYIHLNKILSIHYKKYMKITSV